MKKVIQEAAFAALDTIAQDHGGGKWRMLGQTNNPGLTFIPNKKLNAQEVQDIAKETSDVLGTNIKFEKDFSSDEVYTYSLSEPNTSRQFSLMISLLPSSGTLKNKTITYESIKKIDEIVTKLQKK